MDDLAGKILQLDRSQEETQTEKRAKALGIPYANLAREHLDYDVLKVVPKSQIEAYQCIPLALKSNGLIVGVVQPESDGVTNGLKELEQMTGYKIGIVLISVSSYAYGKKTYDLLVKENEGERPVVITEKNMEELKEIAVRMKSGEPVSDVPVTEQLSSILAKAVAEDASDIHLEPTGEVLEIRFRIDGVLHISFVRPIKEYHALVSRVKYLAKMPLETTQKSQDGRFSITVADMSLDLRVGSLPTIYGEMITIRILRKDQVLRNLSELGLRQDLETLVRESISRPHGMILVSGPTGSGKTTTLYALLQELNNRERKIITIEDPVEYKIEGLDQSQVDPERGFDFAEALRGALRQDPDVLMIGELRDLETATIGIRAALTGHIVLATIHANSAPAAFSRLLEMGVEAYLFTGSVNVAVAQRLVRMLCPSCKQPYSPITEESALLQRELGRVPEKIYKPGKCDKCNNLGYKGRSGIFEAFSPSPEMERLIVAKSSITDMENQAKSDGMHSMMQDGMLKVEQGITTFSEVLRVTKE